MLRLISFLTAILLNSMVSPQVSSEEKAIKHTINTFFDVLHKEDSALVSSTLHTSLNLHAIVTDKKGKKIVLTTYYKEKTLPVIANKNSRQNYLDKLMS